MWSEPIDDDLDLDTLPSESYKPVERTSLGAFFGQVMLAGIALLSVVVGAVVGLLFHSWWLAVGVALGSLVVLFKYIFRKK